jgi:hypothetical protein
MQMCEESLFNYYIDYVTSNYILRPLKSLVMDKKTPLPKEDHVILNSSKEISSTKQAQQHPLSKVEKIDLTSWCISMDASNLKSSELSFLPYFFFSGLLCSRM